MTFEEAKKRIEELGLPMIPYVSDYEKDDTPRS